MASGAGFLETPTYVLCVVFAIFLFMTVAFEKTLHWLKHYFEKHGMHGLLSATNHFVMELALMAFFSLFILIMESVLADICVGNYSDTFKLLHNLMEECVECLDTTNNINIPYECKSPSSDPKYRRNLLGSGDGYGESCPEGKQHLISLAALHQIHIFIFVLALCHIASAVTIILLASLRMRNWRRISHCDSLSDVVHSQVEEYHKNMQRVSTLPDNQENNNNNNGTAFNRMPSSLVVNQARAQKSDRYRQVCWGRSKIWCRCFSHQFYRSIGSMEFNLLKFNFIFTHKLGRSFQFTEYLLRVMEYDFARVTNIGFMYWLAVIILVLISGPLGWMDFVSEIVGIVIVLVVNTILIRVLYEVTCTGQIVNLQRLETQFWFNKPTFLLSLIQCAIFLNTIGFASTAFFAWQFGPHSCYFDDAGFSVLNVPWWVCFILNVVLLLDLGLVTLPLYSAAAQMNSGARWQAHLLPASVQGKLVDTLKKIRAKKSESSEALNNHSSSTLESNAAKAAKEDNSQNSSNSGKQRRESQVQLEELENALIENYYGDVEGTYMVNSVQFNQSSQGQATVYSFPIQINNENQQPQNNS